MAFLDDILGGAQRLSIGEVGNDPIVVDASIRETHSVTGEVSEHPVESGVDIVDHYRVLPRQVSIEAVVTNTPLSTGFPGSTLVNSVIGLVEGPEDENDKGRSLNAWTELQRFFDDAVVVEIKTSLEKKHYQNMVLTSLDVTRDSDTGQVVWFTVTAREVRFVDNKFGEAIELPKTVTGQEAKNAGKKSNSNANPKQADEASLLYNLTN